MSELVHRPLSDQQQAVQLLLDLEVAGAVTETEMKLTDPTMEYDRFESIGVFLGAVKRRSSWWIGDWLNFGEGVYGHEFAQAASATGLNEQTLLHYQFVCRNVPAERRIANLAFGCHALVARLEPKDQTYWLKQAEKKGWGEKELREAMKAKRKDTQPPMFDGDEGTNKTVLEEVAKAILRDAKPADDDQNHLVPNDDIVRLRAALGQEE